MDIIDCFDKNCCSADINASTKENVIKQLAQLACKNPSLDKIGYDTVFEKLKERESQGTTAFGSELALPHARIEGLEDFVVFVATSQKGADFESLDKRKVRIFAVIIGPKEAVNEHLKILAGISRLLSIPHVKTELYNANNQEVLAESFIRNLKVGGKNEESKKQIKMTLLTVILYNEEFMYDVLELFLQEGIEGATIIESSGMGQYISNIPIFADFIGFMRQNKNQSKTIMALIPEDRVDDIIEGIEQITGDMNKHQGAMVFTQEIKTFKGSMKMM